MCCAMRACSYSSSWKSCTAKAKLRTCSMLRSFAAHHGHIDILKRLATDTLLSSKFKGRLQTARPSITRPTVSPAQAYSRSYCAGSKFQQLSSTGRADQVCLRSGIKSSSWNLRPTSLGILKELRNIATSNRLVPKTQLLLVGFGVAVSGMERDAGVFMLVHSCWLPA